MLYRLRYFLLVVTLVLGVSEVSALSCGRGLGERLREGVAIEAISRVTHLSTSGMNLWVDVRNDTSSRLVLKRAEVDILVNGTVRATISLRDRVVVGRRSSGEVLIPLRFRSRSSFALGSLFRALFDGRSEGVAISYRLRGGTMLFRYTVEGESLSLGELRDRVAIPRDIVSQLESVLR